MPKDERTKLDTKLRECIFLGYPNVELGYHLWDLMNKKTVSSRDAVFLEDQMLDDIKKKIEVPMVVFADLEIEESIRQQELEANSNDTQMDAENV